MAWLTGYSYRKSHEIHAATGAGASYQVKITVHWGAGVDSVGDVYLNSHGVDTSFGDIRFTDDDGNTELSYWMESHVDSDNAVFWVKVADSLETDPQTIYIYYGKAATATTSSAVDTLVYFHNFEGETVGQPPTKFLETTNLTIQADTVEGTRCVQNSGAGNGPFERMDMVNNAGVCLDAKMKNSGNFQASMCLRYIDGNNFIQFGGIYGNPANYWGVGQLVGGVWSDTHTAFTWGTGWHDIEVLIYNSSVTATIDGGNSVTKSGLTLLSAGKGAVRQWNSVTAWFDYIRIRKYCSPEPVQHTWGSEEVPATTYNQSCTQTFTSTPTNPLFNIQPLRTQTLTASGNTLFNTKFSLNQTFTGESIILSKFGLLKSEILQGTHTLVFSLWTSLNQVLNGIGLPFFLDSIIGEENITFNDLKILGNSETGDNTSNAGDQIHGNPFTLTEEGFIDSIMVYLKRGGSNPVGPKTKCAIYADDTGVLLGQTEELTISNTDLQWVRFLFSNSIHLFPGIYILAVWNEYVSAGSTKYITYAWTTGGPDYIQALEYGVWPNPWVPDNYYPNDVTWCHYMEYHIPNGLSFSVLSFLFEGSIFSDVFWHEVRKNIEDSFLVSDSPIFSSFLFLADAANMVETTFMNFLSFLSESLDGVEARSIDFLSSFSESITSYLEISFLSKKVNELALYLGDGLFNNLLHLCLENFSLVENITNVFWKLAESILSFLSSLFLREQLERNETSSFFESVSVHLFKTYSIQVEEFLSLISALSKSSLIRKNEILQLMGLISKRIFLPLNSAISFLDSVIAYIRENLLLQAEELLITSSSISFSDISLLGEVFQFTDTFSKKFYFSIQSTISLLPSTTFFEYIGLGLQEIVTLSSTLGFSAKKIFLSVMNLGSQLKLTSGHLLLESFSILFDTVEIFSSLTILREIHTLLKDTSVYTKLRSYYVRIKKRDFGND
jgi:hypothetical protein